MYLSKTEVYVCIHADLLRTGWTGLWDAASCLTSMPSLTMGAGLCQGPCGVLTRLSERDPEEEPPRGVLHLPNDWSDTHLTIVLNVCLHLGGDPRPHVVMMGCTEKQKAAGPPAAEATEDLGVAGLRAWRRGDETAGSAGFSLLGPSLAWRSILSLVQTLNSVGRQDARCTAPLSCTRSALPAPHPPPSAMGLPESLNDALGTESLLHRTSACPQSLIECCQACEPGAWQVQNHLWWEAKAASLGQPAPPAADICICSEIPAKNSWGQMTAPGNSSWGSRIECGSDSRVAVETRCAVYSTTSPSPSLQSEPSSAAPRPRSAGRWAVC